MAMHVQPVFRRRRAAIAPVLALLVAVAWAGPAPAPAQDVPRDVKEGSRNLDVPYEPTPVEVVAAMLDLAGVGPEDFVIDLGAGDGRIVIAAVRDRGARGIGVDLNEELVAIANGRARQAGVAGRARFYVRDIFRTDIDRASVVTMFLSPAIALKLRPKFLDTLAPGTRIVSHQHHLGDWRPDATRLLANSAGWDSIVYLWVVPADAEGLWKWELDDRRLSDGALSFVAKIGQTYQDIHGQVELGVQPMPVRAGAVRGRRVSFSATGEIGTRIVRQDYQGRIEGDAIAGTVRLSGAVREFVLPWRAWRAPDLFR